ncbi:MAG: hypothetical protein HUJ76_04865 [Parasporobacterium sp.]|nr:hypothetical protein [Holdemanella sp.]MCF0229007.1 hypothetical protein [Parasporobacterium sp.]
MSSGNAGRSEDINFYIHRIVTKAMDLNQISSETIDIFELIRACERNGIEFCINKLRELNDRYYALCCSLDSALDGKGETNK